jgi:hypothetical protein
MRKAALAAAPRTRRAIVHYRVRRVGSAHGTVRLFLGEIRSTELHKLLLSRKAAQVSRLRQDRRQQRSARSGDAPQPSVVLIPREKFVSVSHIVLGTDYPLGGRSTTQVDKGLVDNGGFSESGLQVKLRPTGAS